MPGPRVSKDGETPVCARLSLPFLRLFQPNCRQYLRHVAIPRKARVPLPPFMGSGPTSVKRGNAVKGKARREEQNILTGWRSSYTIIPDHPLCTVSSESRCCRSEIHYGKGASGRVRGEGSGCCVLWARHFAHTMRPASQLLWTKLRS